MERLDGSELEGQHSDVALLAEALCDVSDALGGLRRDGAGAVEAEELAGWRLRFNDAVGEEGKGIVGASWRLVSV
jgi:hypothetical protein